MSLRCTKITYFSKFMKTVSNSTVSFFTMFFIAATVFASTDFSSPNLLTDATTSFEVGQRGWGFQFSSIRPQYVQDASEGRLSLQLPSPGEHWVTIMIPVKAGQDYQFSFDAKTVGATASKLNVACLSYYTDRRKIESPTYASKTFKIKPCWSRYSLNIKIPSDARGWCYLRMIQTVDSESRILVDAIRFSSVENETRTLPYVPPFHVEAAISTPDAKDSIFNQPGKCRIDIEIAGPRNNLNATLELKDIMYDNHLSCNLEPVEFGYTTEVKLPAGMFLAHARIMVNGSTLEIYRTITVADHRPLLPHKFNPIGWHFSPSVDGVKEAQWLGFGSYLYLGQFTKWKCVNPQKGEFDFSPEMKANFARTQAAGFINITHLTSGVGNIPQWLPYYLSGKGQWGWHAKLPQKEAWLFLEEYYRRTAEYYYDDVKYFEVYSEANGYMTPDDYMPLLKTAYKTLKTLHQDLKVVGLSATWDKRGDAIPFLKTCLNKGAAEYMDILAIHPYTWPHSPEEVQYDKMLSWLCKIRDQKKKTMPLWATEWGYTSPVLDSTRPITTAPGPALLDPRGHSALEIAAFYVRHILFDLGGGLELTIGMASLRYSGGVPAYRAAGFQLVDYDYTPLPGYLALHEIIRNVVGAKFNHNLTLPPPLYGQLWILPESSRARLILWQTNSKNGINIGPIRKSFEIRDIFGRVCGQEAKITFCPIYITGPRSDIMNLAERLESKFASN